MRLRYLACVYAVHVLGLSVMSGPRVSKRNSGSRGACRLGQEHALSRGEHFSERQRLLHSDPHDQSEFCFSRAEPMIIVVASA